MELTTNRLHLRPFTASDFGAVHSYAGNPANVTYMGWGPNDEQATRAFLDTAIAHWDKDPITDYDFAIVLKDANVVIGGCGIYLNQSRQEGMLGWILHMDYWKQGLMTEAARELLRFGFEQLNLHRLYATCNADNYGSYRVMENCGMTKEAHFRKNRFGRVGDQKKWFDELHYAMLDEDWHLIRK